jgi:hypothetical protein
MKIHLCMFSKKKKKVVTPHIVLVFKLINHLKVKVLRTSNVTMEVLIFVLNRLITYLC